MRRDGPPEGAGDGEVGTIRLQLAEAPMLDGAEMAGDRLTPGPQVPEEEVITGLIGPAGEPIDASGDPLPSACPQMVTKIGVLIAGAESLIRREVPGLRSGDRAEVVA